MVFKRNDCRAMFIPLRKTSQKAKRVKTLFVAKHEAIFARCRPAIHRAYPISKNRSPNILISDSGDFLFSPPILHRNQCICHSETAPVAICSILIGCSCCIPRDYMLRSNSTRITSLGEEWQTDWLPDAAI